jgi:uncharacterized spore protein YtfJ
VEPFVNNKCFMLRSYSLGWDAGGIEESYLHSCSMEHPAKKKWKKEGPWNGGQARGVSSCPITVVVVGQ